jgi:nickel-dependent lactate racemase
MDQKQIEEFFQFTYALSPDEALQKAFSLKGTDARVLVVPQGTTTLLTIRQ